MGLALARPWVRAWHANAVRAWRSLPRPLDAPLVHAVGANPDRLLLLGNGPAVGYGVLSHDLALSGHLARQLSELTGRGTDIEVRGVLDLTASTAPGALKGTDLSRFDAVVLTVGNNDALRLTSARVWRRAMTALLDEIEHSTAHDLHVFVVAIPPLSVTGVFPAAVAALADRHLRTLNDVTRALCAARPAATFLPFEPAVSPDADRHRSAKTYSHWAQLLVGPIGYRLASVPATPSTRPLDPQDEDARQRALGRLGMLDGGPEKRLDEIAALAQQLFGTSAAAVTFLDGDRQRFMARAGFDIEEIDRSVAFCDITIGRRGHFVVRDASKDARFQFGPLVGDTPLVRFYAGYPIEDPDGIRVGALCVMDALPREFSSGAATLLRTLALMAQEALWARADRGVTAR